jgi:hypothetical protein
MFGSSGELAAVLEAKFADAPKKRGKKKSPISDGECANTDGATAGALDRVCMVVGMDVQEVHATTLNCAQKCECMAVNRQ